MTRASITRMCLLVDHDRLCVGDIDQGVVFGPDVALILDWRAFRHVGCLALHLDTRQSCRLGEFGM